MSKVRAPKKVRNICFTLNNYTLEEEAKLTDSDLWRYLIYGREVGENGTPHLQGYMELNRQMNWRSLKKKLGERYHLESRLGTQEEAIIYCKKDGDFLELGTKKKQGCRVDLIELKEKVLKGDKKVRDIIKDDVQNYQQLRFVEGLSKYIALPKEQIKRKVYWYWGPSGIGKTFDAFEEAKNEEYWMSGKDLKWFEGYWGQPNVIIDDFRGDFCTFHFLLRLLDDYPLRVEYKGSSTPWLATTIWVTSTYSPLRVYRDVSDESMKQLLRRISVYRRYVNLGNQVQATRDDILEAWDLMERSRTAHLLNGVLTSDADGKPVEPNWSESEEWKWYCEVFEINK